MNLCSEDSPLGHDKKRSIMKKLIIQIGILAAVSTAYSQQDALYTQYMENQIYVNPAYAGSKEYMQLTGVHRQQWVGFTGAPMTTSFSFHSPLKYKSIGLGMDILNDKIGPINRLSAAANFAYRLHFRGDSKLSFGLKAGMDNYSGDLRAIDASGKDPLAGDLTNAITPTFGAGIYYFAPKWFVGASIPRLTKDLSKKVSGLSDATHVFAIAGCVIPMGNQWKLRPTSQVRYVSGAPLSIDGSLAVVYNDKFWIGGMYRLKSSAGIFVQYQVTPQFKMGYAYDASVNGMQGFNKGSHEIMLSYGLIRLEKGLISPRYF